MTARSIEEREFAEKLTFNIAKALAMAPEGLPAESLVALVRVGVSPPPHVSAQRVRELIEETRARMEAEGGIEKRPGPPVRYALTDAGRRKWARPF